jgi:DNA repair exonuclease SbcCD ATPase subunit
MNRASLPHFVRDQLDALEQTVAQLNEKVQRTQEGIDSSRSRLEGAFKDAAEEGDLRASLMDLIGALPVLQQKLGRAKAALLRSRQFVNELPDDAVLERIAVRANGLDRRALAAQLKAAEDELQALRAVPMPAPDIEDRIRDYVAAQARPKLMGIGSGQSFDVVWPNDVTALLALLLPTEMTNALLNEAERQSNTPMPLAQRQQRIAELGQRIDTLQRQTFALDADTTGLPAEVILGVRVVPAEQMAEQRIERRQRVASAADQRRARGMNDLEGFA